MICLFEKERGYGFRRLSKRFTTQQSEVVTKKNKLADLGNIKKNNFIHCNCNKMLLIRSPLISIKQMKSSGLLYLQLPCEILIGSESSGKPAPAKCSSVKYSSKASDLIVVQLGGFTSSLHPVEDKQGLKCFLPIQF